MKAVVLLSGGQDSVTLLFWALKNYKDVVALSFEYGQRHSVELECAKSLTSKLGIKHFVVSAAFMQEVADSALLSCEGDVSEMVSGLPRSFVPNRNQLFLTVACTLAQKIDAPYVVAGMCQTDYSGYPDCRRDFIDQFEKVVKMGSGVETFIVTPLMYLDKSQTWELARKLGCINEVVEHSHTCYNGVRDVLHEWGYGCGECPACKLRKQGYEKFKNSLCTTKD